jgi:hypothetical protein
MSTQDPSRQSWSRLVAAARRAPAPAAADESAPYGFATRVAALALAAEGPLPALFSRRLWLRVLGASCLIAVAAVASNLSAITTALGDEPVPAAVGAGAMTDDPVAEVVDLAS